jgi:hypothetical protein
LLVVFFIGIFCSSSLSIEVTHFILLLVFFNGVSVVFCCLWRLFLLFSSCFSYWCVLLLYFLLFLHCLTCTVIYVYDSYQLWLHCGNHPTNYKRCTVHKDLQKKTYPPLHPKIYTPPAQLKPYTRNQELLTLK